MRNMKHYKIGVTSRSFSRHPILREEIKKTFKNVKFNDKGISLNGDDLVSFLCDCDGAITALENINHEVLSRLPNLKVIGKYGVGIDMIDLHAMSEFNVKLGWTGGVNKRSVSELVVSLAISLLHRAVYANAEVKLKKWYQIKGRQLTGCTFGIIGCGHIGKDVVRMLTPFNCKILSHDIQNFPDFYKKYNVKAVSLKELVRKSDVISIHLPLNSSTINIINKTILKLFKKNAILINLARGGLIDEEELKKQLILGRFGGLALDVFENEPPTDFELAQFDNVFITPHIGGSTEEAILAMGIAAIKGLTVAKNPLLYL
jgi:phosphoglycerate dehydrogenase-like enzyme